ncbi:MAG: PIN domain-containing protein [Candidatus Riflebacteria bacterium]|nr:PIN domain-containing protein [Candidatus Riflebacteria bacterium]
MGILIDSSVLIEWERKHFDIKQLIEPHQGENFYISVVTISELLHALHRAKDPRQKMRRSAFVETVISEFEALESDVQTARIHGEISASLAKQGIIVGSQDLWIGCTGISNGLTIVTHNLKDFRRIPGLQIEQWPCEDRSA